MVDVTLRLGWSVSRERARPRVGLRGPVSLPAGALEGVGGGSSPLHGTGAWGWPAQGPQGIAPRLCPSRSGAGTWP